MWKRYSEILFDQPVYGMSLNVLFCTILRINPNVGNITIYTSTAVNVITHTTQVGSLIRSLFIVTSQTGILLNDWNKK